MNVEDILASADWQKCTAFHGHTCPGIAIGYRAAKAGMDLLKEQRALDEELVSIVETDACDADAIQVLTGCTFGKGNFIYKEYGKHAFTFFSRNSAKGVRLVLRPDALDLSDEQQGLIERVRDGVASRTDQEAFEKLHFQRTKAVLAKPLELLFTVKPVEVPIPEKARIEPTKICERCGEPAMATRFTEVDGKLICRGCLEA